MTLPLNTDSEKNRGGRVSLSTLIRRRNKRLPKVWHRVIARGKWSYRTILSTISLRYSQAFPRIPPLKRFQAPPLTWSWKRSSWGNWWSTTSMDIYKKTSPWDSSWSLSRSTSLTRSSRIHTLLTFSSSVTRRTMTLTTTSSSLIRGYWTSDMWTTSSQSDSCSCKKRPRTYSDRSISLTYWKWINS